MGREAGHAWELFPDWEGKDWHVKRNKDRRAFPKVLQKMQMRREEEEMEVSALG